MSDDIHSLSPELRSLVNNELDRGEQITWLGRAIPGLLARKYLPLMFFGIPFGGFAVFWIVSALTMGGGAEREGVFAFFPLFGLPFLLVGVGMVCSPLYGRWQANRTVYAITDRRAIVFAREWSGMTIRSFRPVELRSIERRQRADGTGDLVFEKELSIHRNRNSSVQTKEIGFLGVADVKRVEDRIEELVKQTEETSAES